MLCHSRQEFRDRSDAINYANHRRLDHSGSPHHKFVEMACHGCKSRSINPTVRATMVVVLRCCCRNLRRRVSPSRDLGIVCNQREMFCCKFAADAAAGKIGCNTRLSCVLEPVTASAGPSGSVADTQSMILWIEAPPVLFPSPGLDRGSTSSFPDVGTKRRGRPDRVRPRGSRDASIQEDPAPSVAASFGFDLYPHALVSQSWKAWMARPSPAKTKFRGV